MAEQKSKLASLFKSNKKIDIPTTIFFVLMVVGLIIFTIIIFSRANNKIYTKEYGDFIISAQLYNNGNIDIIVDANDNKVCQTGKYEEIDDDITDNYIATFDTDENDIIKVKLLIIDDELKLIYDDNSEIVLKEKK